MLILYIPECLTASLVSTHSRLVRSLPFDATITCLHLSYRLKACPWRAIDYGSISNLSLVTSLYNHDIHVRVCMYIHVYMHICVICMCVCIHMCEWGCMMPLCTCGRQRTTLSVTPPLPLCWDSVFVSVLCTPWAFRDPSDSALPPISLSEHRCVLPWPMLWGAKLRYSHLHKLFTH